MKKLFSLPLFLLSIISLAQQNPKITLKDSSQLKLSSLKIDVTITGNFAQTTYDMKFYNEVDQTLEGELAFPLGEGQAVSRFAMELNGKLREAVVVEKELARVAYESTIRQNIDPALLEKVQGDNYKARVYPILPNAYKRIVVTYEQELFSSGNLHTYELPLGISKKLDSFSVNIAISGGTDVPNIKNNNYSGFYFKQEGGGYKARLNKQDFAPASPIVVQVPSDTSKEAALSYNNYFYLHKTLQPNSRLKEKPKKITILYDASYSMKNRNAEAEIDLLREYFSYLQNVEVQFVSFSNAVIENKQIDIHDCDFKELEKNIKNTKYDGGTSFSILNELKLRSDEILLFTDGLSNLGELHLSKKQPIYTINSLVSANHENLNSIATVSGGNYINLLRLPYSEAIKILKTETYQFLGIAENNFLSEVFPYKNSNVTSDFAIAGIFSKNTEIELLFGYNGKVTDRIKTSINKSNPLKLVERLWAKQKLNNLNENKTENKDEIIALAIQHHLITDFTSMIVLDRIEDYVRYKIEPPKELMAEYKERLAQIAENKDDINEGLQERKEEIAEYYEEILEWYNTTFPEKEIKNTKKLAAQNNQTTNNTQNNSTAVNPSNSTQTEASDNDQIIPINPQIRTIALDSTKRTVSGIITDDTGLPLPGANAIVRGTNRGTQSDFDGNFSINAEEDDILDFSYVGFESQTIYVSDKNKINIVLNPGSSLDEVVVTGYGVSRERTVMTSSVTSIVSESLSGQAAGISAKKDPSENPTIMIRGAAAVTDSQPLYIVDGVPLSTYTIENLNPEDIEYIQVFSGENAAKLYGSRAVNGLIIVTTKEGLKTNQAAIEEVAKQIEEKIELKAWNPETPYLTILKQEPNTEAAYQKYLQIRDQYSNSPSFFLDVSDFFYNKGSQELAYRIVTNLIEVELDNHELLKALAYKLEYFKQYELAVYVYRKVLELRPEEPQSYRDLALAYEQNGQIRESFDLLYRIHKGELLEKDPSERYYGIEFIASVELTRLVNKYGRKLKLSKDEKKKFPKIPLDVRIVIDWNHNDTDIDLWVIDPNGEKAFYQNDETKIGGQISEDMTDGYGPETYMLKKAIKGNYSILIDYYADNVQKISGPTILKVTLFTNYGRKNEKKEVTLVRLDKDEDDIEVATLKFSSY